MRQTWRWFGPKDLVSIDDMLQAGVEGVVTALHHAPTGAVWTADEIEARKIEIGHMKDGSPSGFTWEVVESLPVSEDIKKQKGEWRGHIDNYKISLRNLAAAGIEVVCYNFMPVLDWTRTDLAWRLGTGATCMRFDYADFAAFDIHILERGDASSEFSEAIVNEAAKRFAAMDDKTKEQLVDNIVCGLPGAAEHFTLKDVCEHLAEYEKISTDGLRNNLTTFLEEVVPVAEEVGIRLCCHPDDPPFPLLGLPRVMSTEADYRAIMEAVDSKANGITLCSGSLGARPDNDLPGMMERLGDRVHFLHLRNVKRETSEIRGSFYEAEHLGGDTDMVALIAAILKEEARRREAGRADHAIPMRPGSRPGHPGRSPASGSARLSRHRAIARSRRTPRHHDRPHPPRRRGRIVDLKRQR